MIPKLKEVLIIDDDLTTNYLNERIVNDLQIAQQVKVFYNGKEGLDYILSHCGENSQNKCPELIILDHHMPVMDGMELMQKLQGHSIIENMKTVFLLLAVQTSVGDLQKFTKLGVQEFSNKPLSKERLLEAYNKYWANETTGDIS